MGTWVYLLCMLTSISCAGFLLKGYFKSKYKLLLWSGMKLPRFGGRFKGFSFHPVA